MTEAQFIALVTKTLPREVRERDVTKGPFIESESWRSGGTYGNCWDDSMSSVEGDMPLTEFETFDNLLSILIPDIGFLQYKKMRKECVFINEEHDGCYYGGSGVTTYTFRCELRHLYRTMAELNLLDKIS